jgi:hypothetical protein
MHMHVLHARAYLVLLTHLNLPFLRYAATLVLASLFSWLHKPLTGSSFSLARRSRIAGFVSPPYPRGGVAASPVNSDTIRIEYRASPQGQGRSITSYDSFLAAAQQQAPDLQATTTTTTATSPLWTKRILCHGINMDTAAYSPESSTAHSVATTGSSPTDSLPSPLATTMKSPRGSATSNHKHHKRVLSSAVARKQSRDARRINDEMVYLEGPVIYCCGECGTHLTTHGDIVSKSFHGRHGRAYLLDSCVNITVGRAEDRRLMTGLHSVCDIFCKRCNTLVGWTYKRAYELSQKYKEGKFIVEKIFLQLEDDGGEAHFGGGDRRSLRRRSMSWGSDTAAIDSSSLSLESSSSQSLAVASAASTKMTFEYSA